mgnify:CR=1 FL=1
MESSLPAPHYLDDLDSSLISLIRTLSAQDKPLDTSAAIARTCRKLMWNIYDHMGKEKLALRYFKMSELNVDV